jgi:AcrR family transcriptional regulator
MTRRAQHRIDDILDAARGLVLERGARSATVDAIASASGAPVGSLYYRFGSRDGLVGELWIRAVRRSQAAFLDALGHPDPEQAAVDAALSIHDFVARHRDDARLLVSFRREDLLHGARSPKSIRTLQDLNRPIEERLNDLTRRLFKRVTAENVQRTTLAVIDIPFGVLRRHLVAGNELPSGLREQLEAAVRAVLRVGGRSL